MKRAPIFYDLKFEHKRIHIPNQKELSRKKFNRQGLHQTETLNAIY